MPLENIFATFFGARWLGHGRMTEASLAFICLLYGVVMLAWAPATWDSQAFRDLASLGYGHLVGIPFLIKAAFTGCGLIANINEWRYSRFLRFVGASVGSFIWIFLIFKFSWVGVPFTFGSVCSIVFLVSSIRIIGMCLANLPRPGTPGALH